jgi:hypothetical protein
MNIYLSFPSIKIRTSRSSFVFDSTCVLYKSNIKIHWHADLCMYVCLYDYMYKSIWYMHVLYVCMYLLIYVHVCMYICMHGCLYM